MKKFIMAFMLSLSLSLVGCGQSDTSDVQVENNMTQEEKDALLNLMTENLEGEWQTEDGDILQVTPDGHFLYETSTGLVSLQYTLIDAFNVELIGAKGKPETKPIYFEDMGDKFKLDFNKKTYYKNK